MIEKDQIIVFGTILLGIIAFLLGVFTTWISLNNSIIITIFLFVFAGSYGRLLIISNQTKYKMLLVIETLLILGFSESFFFISLTNSVQAYNFARIIFVIVIVIGYWLGTGIKSVLGLINQKKIIISNNSQLS